MKNSDLLQTAYAILSRRAYSEWELRQKLLQKGFDKEQMNEVIGYLAERGYLNDAALCNMLVRKYMNCGKYGKKAIVNKVLQRGVSGDIIQNTMAMHNFDELSQAIHLIEKVFNKESKSFDKAKTGRFLMNRGFSYSTVQQVFEYLENIGK